jgi:hypothetical protein
MSVKDLSQGDFAYWQKYGHADRNCHQEEFLQEANPDLMHALYRGYKSEEYKKCLKDPAKLRDHIVTYSKIFTACNTILPNLMYQMPRFLAVPEGETDPLNAATMTSALNHYHRVLKQKQENQQAVLNSWFFGLSWKKVGYYTPSEPRVQSPETEGAKVGQPADIPLQFQEVQSSFRDEGLFNSFESPMNVWIDHKGTLTNYKTITHALPRTLQDLYEYGMYDPEMIQQMVAEYEDRNGSRFDARDVKFNIRERMIEQRNGIWILVYADEFNKPLMYEKMTFDKIPWYPLALTNEPNVRYPVAHMGVASRPQRWIDEIASRYVEMIGKTRSQHFINEDILAKGQSKEGFLKNLIGGIYWGKRPAMNGDIVEIKSSQITPDIQTIIKMLDEQVTGILGADSQRVEGRSTNDTLGQDKLAAIGTEIRESGMLDKVRDWMIAQGECEIDVLKKHGGAELKLQMTSQDFHTQEAAQQTLGGDKKRMLEFRTQNQPLPMSAFTQNDDYSLLINVYEAVKPDKKELAREYDEFMGTYSNPMVLDALLQNDVQPDLGLVAEERAKLFEYLDSTRFMKKLTIEQKTALQVQKMVMQSGIPQSGPPKPPSKSGEGAKTIPDRASEIQNA